jgi:phytoene dehydrogenase-like protein
MAQHHDAIIIGAGHNGLTTAAYLAKAGLDVLVLERRHLVGGAAVSEEIFPGFTYSVCSYVVSLMQPEVVRDLDLARHGFEVLPLEGYLAPGEDGNYIQVSDNAEETRREIARHSRRDAEAYDEFNLMMYSMAHAVKPLLSMVPFDPAEPGLRGSRTALELGRHLRDLGPKRLNALTKLMTMSASDYLDEWFESDQLKAVLALNGIIGTFLGPRSPGTAYVMLHHFMGGVDGAFTVWGFQKGGTGGVSEAIASAARSFGATIRCEAPVEQVLVKRGEAVGVALANGEEISADLVVSGADPRVTFRKLVDERELPDELITSIDNFKFRGSSGKVNLALDGLPTFTCRPEPEALHGFVEIAPSMDFLERAFDDAKYGDFSRRPYMDCIIPSLVDPTVAPPGKHMMSLFVQYAPYELEGGWNDVQREAFGDAVVKTLAEFAPDIEDHILHRQVLTPWDLEQEFSLSEGNIFQGELTLDQLFFNRPAPQWADYRTPIRGYYQCGSGTHPGGGITSAPGRLAALEILADHRRRVSGTRARRASA